MGRRRSARLKARTALGRIEGRASNRRCRSRSQRDKRPQFNRSILRLSQDLADPAHRLTTLLILSACMSVMVLLPICICPVMKMRIAARALLAWRLILTDAALDLATYVDANRALPKMHCPPAHGLGDVQCQNGNGKDRSGEAHRASKRGEPTILFRPTNQGTSYCYGCSSQPVRTTQVESDMSYHEVSRPTMGITCRRNHKAVWDFATR